MHGAQKKLISHACSDKMRPQKSRREKSDIKKKKSLKCVL